MQPTPDDLSQLPSAYEFPHVIALLLLIVVLTASVEIWSARRSPDKALAQSVSPLALLVSIPMAILYAGFVYFLPAFIIVAIFKAITGEGNLIVAANFATEFADPVFKLALMICLTDNFTETWRYEEKASFKSHAFVYLLFLPLSYYGGILIAWILARIIAAGGGFQAKFVDATSSLFSLPVFVHHARLNVVLIAGLVLLGALLIHPLIEMRRE